MIPPADDATPSDATPVAPEIARVPPESAGGLHDVMGGAGRWEVKVHDHGLVALVDVMPRLVPARQTADAAIVQAARVSYGEGTKRVNEDRGLIRYLMRHRHSTPLEMVELKFHFVMPIFVARQHLRHRTACLAEGTEIYFDLPGGVRRRGNQLYKLPIEQVADRFDGHGFGRERVRGMRLRQVDESDLRLRHTRIVNVYRNGPRPVFRMTLADGKRIEATSDHRFLFADGWATLKQRTGLRESGGRAVWDGADHFLYVNGQTLEVPALYQDRGWMREQYHRLGRRIEEMAGDCGVSYHTIRKWLRRHGLQQPFRFRVGQQPWNDGKRYLLGPRVPSAAWREANRSSRSGPASNFWRGGISGDRQNIGRWTTQVAAKVHRRNGWTCQLCHGRPGELHCHHVVPVWADPARGRDESNLTTLCGDCHRAIGGRELEHVERLGGPPVRAEWRKRPRVPWNKLTVAKLVRVERFEYVGEKATYDLEVEGPDHNFIANGIVTHNSVNEYSGRYSVIRDRFYRPAADYVRAQSSANRQGGGEALEAATAGEFDAWLGRVEAEYAEYERFVARGVARETARLGLPASVYTEFYWKIDLHNLFHFLSLRLDAHAQREIRDYANAVFAMVREVAPIACEAFVDYRLESMHLTRLEIDALRSGRPLASENKREAAEWEEKRRMLEL